MSGLPVEVLSRAQLRLVIGDLADGMLVFESDGRLSYANAAALGMHRVELLERLGSSVAEYRSRFALQYRDGHVLSDDEHPATRVLAGEAVSGLIVEIARHGQVVHGTAVLRGMTIPADTEDGREFHILVFSDASEEVSVEKRFEQTFAANPIPALICRLHDHRFTRVNDGFLRMTGYRREAVIGRSVYEIDVLEGAENRKQAINLLAQGQVIPQSEARLRMPEGGSRLVIVAGQPVEVGRHRCMLFTFTDLEHRSRAETTLRESEERFATAFRMSPTPMLISTLSGHLIQDANDAFVRDFGHERSGAIGRSKADLALWADADTRRSVERQLAQTGRVHAVEAKLRTTGSAILECLMSSESVTILDERCVLTVIQNITVQRRSNTQLTAAVEAVMQDASWLGQQIVARINSVADVDNGAQALSNAASLSGRERQVLALISQGATDKAMAAALRLSVNTVKNHIRAVYRKIGVNKRAEAVVWAHHCGITNHAYQGKKGQV